jgi:hypothetical protein
LGLYQLMLANILILKKTQALSIAIKVFSKHHSAKMVAVACSDTMRCALRRSAVTGLVGFY